MGGHIRCNSRNDIGCKANEPDIARLIRGARFTRGRHVQIHSCRRSTAVHNPLHHRGQLIGRDFIHHAFAV